MYLDPGFGSLLIQMIVAAIAASGAFLFAFKSRIKTWWTKRKGKPVEEQAPAGEAGAPPSAAAERERQAQGGASDGKPE